MPELTDLRGSARALVASVLSVVAIPFGIAPSLSIPSCPSASRSRGPPARGIGMFGVDVAGNHANRLVNAVRVRAAAAVRGVEAEVREPADAVLEACTGWLASDAPAQRTDSAPDDIGRSRSTAASSTRRARARPRPGRRRTPMRHLNYTTTPAAPGLWRLRTAPGPPNGGPGFERVCRVRLVLLEDVEAGAAVEDVEAWPADQDVVAVATEQGVVPAAADEQVVACAAVEREHGRVGRNP